MYSVLLYMIWSMLFGIISGASAPTPTAAPTTTDTSELIIISTNTLNILIAVSVSIMICCGCILICCCAGICYHYRDKPTVIKEFHIDQIPNNTTMEKQRVQSRSRISLQNHQSGDTVNNTYSQENLIIDINDTGHITHNTQPSQSNHSSTIELQDLQNQQNNHQSSKKSKKRHHRKKSSKSHHRKKSKSKKHKKTVNIQHKSQSHPNPKSVLSSPSKSPSNYHPHEEMQQLQLNRAEGDSINPSETKDSDLDNMPSNNHRVEKFAKLQRRVTAGADLNDDNDDDKDDDDDCLLEESKNDKNGHNRFNSEELYVEAVSKPSDASETPFGDTSSGGGLSHFTHNTHNNIIFKKITNNYTNNLNGFAHTPQLSDIHDEKKLNDIITDDEENEIKINEHEREHSHSASTLTVQTIQTNHTTDGHSRDYGMNETGNNNYKNHKTPKGIPLMSPTTTTTDTTANLDIDPDAMSPISPQSNLISHMSQRTLSGPEGGIIIERIDNGNNGKIANLELYDDELALEIKDNHKQRKHSKINELYPSHIKQQQFLNENGLTSPTLSSEEMEQKMALNIHKNIENADAYSESMYTMDGHRRNTMMTQMTSRSEGDKFVTQQKELQFQQQQAKNIPDLREESQFIDYQDEDDMKSIHHATIKKHLNDKKNKMKKKSKKEKKDRNKKDKKDKKDKRRKKKKSRKDKKKDINENKNGSSQDMNSSDDDDVLVGLKTPAGPPPVHQPSSPFQRPLSGPNHAFHTQPNLKYVPQTQSQQQQQQQQYMLGSPSSPNFVPSSPQNSLNVKSAPFPVNPMQALNLQSMQPMQLQNISPFIVDEDKKKKKKSSNSKQNTNKKNDDQNINNENDGDKVKAPPRFVRVNNR